MTGSESKALMLRITEEVWNEGRLEVIDELVDDSFVDHIDVPGVDATGRARYRAHVELTRTAFPDFRNEVDVVVVDGDLAVSYGRTVGTQNGEMWGLPPSGRRVECETFGMLRFAEGKVIERWGVADNLAMMTQLGLMG